MSKKGKREVRRFGTAAEEGYGFAQAVRVGKTVYISGQTASAVDGATGPPATWTRRCAPRTGASATC